MPIATKNVTHNISLLYKVQPNSNNHRIDHYKTKQQRKRKKKTKQHTGK